MKTFNKKDPSAARASLSRRFNLRHHSHCCSALCMLAAVQLSMAPLAANAAEENESTAVRLMEEITVTARKRSESMYEIPISIDVLSETTLENLGAGDFTDIFGNVPSLSAYQNGPGRTRISIRGVANGGGNDNDTQNQETVGIYLDEIPISMGGMNPEISLFDLQRIEVLRGPQGTLYGAGSMTGTIRQVSKKPSLNEFGGKLEGDLSTVNRGDDSYAVKGLINVPLVENEFAIRASAYYSDEGGYMDNINTGESDYNSSKSEGGRITARWNSDNKLIVDFSYLYHNYSDEGRPEDFDRTPKYTRDDLSFDGYDDELTIYNLGIAYDFGWGELVSSSSYFDRTVDNRRSLDALFDTPALPPEVTPHELKDTTDTNVYAQEIRLSSTTDSPLQWTIGAYADRKEVFYLNTFPVPGVDAILGVDAADFGAPKDFLFYGFDDLTVETYAFFGELYYTWRDFTLTVGLRYFDWELDINYYQSGLFNGEASSDPRPKSSVDDTNPKYNLAYQINDNALVYAQAAKGFRYGGINGSIPRSVCAEELEQVERSGGDTRFFGPDEIWNYEIGSKGELADGRIRYSAAYFYIDWTDMQTSRSFECGFGFKENVGKATSEGVEIELTIQPIDGLIWHFGGSYVDSSLDEDVPNLQAQKGDPAPYVGDWNLSTSLEYSHPLENGLTGFAWINARYTDDRGTEFSKQQPNYRKMDSYTVANLRLGLRADSWDLAIYAKNLFDDDGSIRSIRRPPFDPDAQIRERPRTIGLTAKYHF